MRLQATPPHHFIGLDLNAQPSVTCADGVEDEVKEEESRAYSAIVLTPLGMI